MTESRKRKDYSPIVMSVVLVLVFWLALSFPDKQHFSGPGLEVGGQIIFTSSPISKLLDWVTPFALVASVIVLIFSVFRKNWQGIILFVAMAGTLFAAFVSAIDQAGDYQDASLVKDAQGNEYHLLTSSFLQGHHLIVSKVVRHSNTETVYEILADDTWENDCLHVVRAKDATDESHLYLTPSGVLVALGDTNLCFIAYDINSKTRYDTEGSHKLSELSPFILLRDGDTPNDKDFEDLLHQTGDLRPDKKVIKPDLLNPNPKVREMAARYLKVVQK